MTNLVTRSLPSQTLAIPITPLPMTPRVVPIIPLAPQIAAVAPTLQGRCCTWENCCDRAFYGYMCLTVLAGVGVVLYVVYG